MSNSEWGGWGASVQGPAHEKLGIPNQDSFLIRRCRWGEAAVISDGLGSKPHSDIGSKAACRAVVEAAKAVSRIEKIRIADLLRLIHAYWRINIFPFQANECSATCLFVIRRGDKFLLGRLGDGLLAVLAENPEMSFCLSDDKSDSFSNITNCLSEEFSLKGWETKTLRDFNANAFVLCTDGIADDLLPGYEIPFSQAIHDAFSPLSAPVRKFDLVSMMRNWSTPGHTDDKTITCLYRKFSIDGNSEHIPR